MILPGGLSVFPLLPTVAILSVLHLLPIVQDHGTILRPGSTGSGRGRGEGGGTKTERNMKPEDFEGGPAGGLISEVHKERRHKFTPARKCTSGLEDEAFCGVLLAV